MRTPQLLLALPLLTGLAAAQGSFDNLGLALTPSAVSGDGSVVAGYDGGQYFHWTTGTGLVPVGGATPGAGTGGQAGISYDGRFFCGTTVDPQTGWFTMSRYDRVLGSWTVLGSLGASSGNDSSSGWGISGDGGQVVGLGWINAGQAHGIYWNAASGVVDIGSTVANRSTRANACDYDGNVIVGWQDNTTGFRQGAVWTNGVQTLVDQAGSPMGELGSVSADGVWAGGVGVASNQRQAYLWSAASGVINLGHLDPSYSGAVTGVSADGTVAVGYDRPFGPAIFGKGFLWTQATGMLDINTVAANAGVNVGGAILSLPLAISADGRTIVGAGRLNNQAIGWRLVLPPSACGYEGYGYGASVANRLVLAGLGNPAVGGQARLRLTGALGNTGTIGLSTGSSNLPIAGGVVLLDPVGLINLYGATPTPTGALLVLAVPANPAFAGLQLYAQGLAFEPSLPEQLAFSNGVKATLCP